MKLSIAWIFDHINADWENRDIDRLVAQANQTIAAEIENFYKISTNLDQITLVQVKDIVSNGVLVFSAEWKESYTVTLRPSVKVGDYYLLNKDTTWTSMKDLGGIKDHLLPALSVPSALHDGAWKNSFPSIDYILEIDNKSINHRPDLWSHRGFAREIAAMLNLPLKPLEQYLVQLPIKEYAATSVATVSAPLVIDNQAPQACKRFAGLYIQQVNPCASFLWMTQRLCSIDNKAINALVDTTNYVMLDIGQPMHVFNAEALATKTVAPRFAQDNDTLNLLDGTTITLSSQDLVITDGNKPLALAGIMGGSASGVQTTTTEIFVEAACFDATTVRLSAMRHKIRTESSSRFEKSLDPYQATNALMRFVAILKEKCITLDDSLEIIACGSLPPITTITVSHDFIERRLGTKIASSQVIAILERLEFGVHEAHEEYTLTVPSFRATKDIAIKEDIVEEIGRFIGYQAIPAVMPMKQCQISDLTPLMRVRTIKNTLAYALQMVELYNYSLYDELFLRELGWDPGSTLAVESPISEHWRRLVTSLVPHLLKAVQQNVADNDQLRFFEWGRTWHEAVQAKGIVEKKVLAGIFFDAKKQIDFYQAKVLLEELFNALRLPVVWSKIDNPLEEWFRPYQTADLLYNNQIIGRVGMAQLLFLHKIAPGDAFIFELDGNFLENYQPPVKKCEMLTKYPEVIRDISLLVPYVYTTDSIAEHIQHTDKHIINVVLIDFFDNAAWEGKRAMTFRCTLQDSNKTLTKPEVDEIMTHVIKNLQEMGAVIR